MRALTLAATLLLVAAAPTQGARLDHLVVGASDLDAGIVAFEALAGVRPTVGGEHPGAGTRNALASLGEGLYLEILAPVDGAAGESPFGALGSLDGLTPLTWAVAVDDAQATAERLTTLGHQVYGPVSGSRVLPGGGTLEWQIVALSDAPPHFPFFIQWGEGSPHPSTTSPSGCSLASLAVTGPDVDSLRALLEPLALPVELAVGTEPPLDFSLDCPTGRVDLTSAPIEPAGAGGSPPDGALLERTSCSFSVESYDALLDILGSRSPADPRDSAFDEAAFRRSTPEEGFLALTTGRVSCSKIVYASGGERVSGFLVRPTDDGPWPAVIYNRGGTGDFGSVRLGQLIRFAGLAERGYAVLASQYRGADGGTGRDEYGGADVQDVLSLFPLARDLGTVDMDNVFMWGDSRGGMMTFRAIRAGAEVRAAAVVGAPTDLERGLLARPEMGEVYREAIPDYAEHESTRLRERSALHWPEALDVPILLLHGGADWRVSPDDARDLARELEELGAPHELVVYAEDDHPLTARFPDAFERMLAWFAEHRAPAPAAEPGSR